MAIEMNPMTGILHGHSATAERGSLEFQRRKDPPHWEQLMWELEAEYGSVVDVPGDDPRLIEIRQALGMRKANDTSTDYDDLVWTLHVQGLSIGRIMAMTDLTRNAASAIINRLKYQKHDERDYVNEAIHRYLKQRKSPLEIADILGFARSTIMEYKRRTKEVAK